MQIIKYPQNFYDFSDGLDVSGSEINIEIWRMINSLKTRLRDSKAESDFTNWATGNTVIIVWAYKNQTNDNYMFKAVVCKGYHEKTIWDVKV